MSLILLSPSSLLSISDGDTPEVKMGVRMLGIDTPELHFPGNSNPEKQDPILLKLPEKDVFKKLPEELKNYLLPRLEGAGKRQKKWAKLAKVALEEIVDVSFYSVGKGKTLSNSPFVKGENQSSSLKKRDTEGRKFNRGNRKIFLAVGKEVIDCYGRILAYCGPYLTKEERKVLGQPDTFNLKMLKLGFAISNIHSGNLPKDEDIELVIKAVKEAREKKMGFWSEKDKILHGYEFRALVRMSEGEKGFRYKVGDLRDHLSGKEMKFYKPEEYIKIEEEFRVFK